MSNLTNFDFESNRVRVVTKDGEPWFVGKDVCVVLGYVDHTNAMKQHCKGVVKRHPLQTAGGIQEVRVLSESDVLRLIVGSKLPAAEAFERWVFEEVLPTIRKTGSYTMPKAATSAPRAIAATEDSVAALILLGDRMASLPGVKAGIAMAATLTAVNAVTGLDVTAFRAILPPADHPICSLNAMKVGKELGITAVAANIRLESAGFQVRNERNEWELTKKGEKWGEALPYSIRGHSGYQILWNPAVVNELKVAK